MAADDQIEVLIATGRLEHREVVAKAPRGRIPAHLRRREWMARKLRTKKGRAVYACDECDMRALGEQLGSECNRFYLNMRVIPQSGAIGRGRSCQGT